MTRTEVSDDKKTDSEPVVNGDSNQIPQTPEKASTIEEKKADELETTPTTKWYNTRNSKNRT